MDLVPLGQHGLSQPWDQDPASALRRRLFNAAPDFRDSLCGPLLFSSLELIFLFLGISDSYHMSMMDFGDGGGQRMK